MQNVIQQIAKCKSKIMIVEVKIYANEIANFYQLFNQKYQL
jgi:hypothetical protein